MDKLSHLICDAVNSGGWVPFKTSRQGPTISHLLFADDLLLFGEASEKQIDCMLQCLDLFCSSSGQKVNRAKSSILFSRNVENDRRRSAEQASKYLRIWVPILGFLCIEGRRDLNHTIMWLRRCNKNYQAGKPNVYLWRGERRLLSQYFTLYPFILCMLRSSGL